MSQSTLHRAFARAQAGIGLVEVLLAVLVIGLGVVGLSKFQGVVLREGGIAMSRGIAAQLAREKLDDLRNFSQLAAGGNGVFGYDEIGTNLGGMENADGTLRLPSGTVTVSNTAYNRTWTATAYYYCANNAIPQTANCSVNPKSRPDYYAARVTVSWTDRDGTARTLALDDAINSMNPLAGALALISGGSSTPPLVGYRPGQAPQVIAIDLGGGQNKETTNPTPTLNKKGQTVINTIARYETVRYSSSDNTITREQFTTLNCSCTENGTGAALNLLGQPVTKRIGVPSDANQAAECTVCCRDHHDDSSCDMSTSTGKNSCYDPYRPTSDFDSSTHDHNHYDANGALANAQGTTYREACRLKRVNGYLQVAQDWHLAQLNEIPQDFFAPGGSPDQTAITNYGTYVKNYVASLITGGAAPAKIWPASVTLNAASTAQFNARGIYVDYMDDTTKAGYATRIGSGDATVYQSIPFYEVNMTKLAQWSSSNNAIATVRNDALVTEAAGQNLYTRGLVTGLTPGTVTITASTTASNTGVINEFITTDPDDGAVFISDTLSVTVPGTHWTISGTVSPAVPITVSFATTNSGGPCTYSTTTGAYSCIVPLGWTGTITPSASGYTFAPTSRSYTSVTGNLTTGQDYTSTAVSTNLTISGTITPALGTATLTASNGGSCTYTSATGTYSCTVPNLWSGTITPSAGGYTFSPGSYSYSGVSANLTGQNFTATLVATNFTISGTVSPAVPTAAVAAAGSSSVSCSYNSSTGAYSCVVPAGWTGTVAPSAAGYSFSPLSRSYSNVSSDQTGQDFATLYTIAGTVAPAISGVSFAATNSGVCGSYNATTGAYSCTVPYLWSGTITPSVSGYTFSPPSRTYSNVTSSYSAENYSATAVPPLTFTITGQVTGLSSSKGTGTTGGVLNTSVSATQGGSCTATKVNNSTVSYTCSVTIQSGATWSGVVTPSINSSGTKTITPSNRSYTNINSNQTGQNFACSGGGC